MNVKQLRDYLNSLDLDNVQTDITVVSSDENNDLRVDTFGDIIIVVPENRLYKPYFSIYTEDAVNVCASE